MRSMCGYLVTFALLLVITTPAFAYLTVGDYQKQRASGQVDANTKFYLIGASDAFAAANATLEALHQRPLFCAVEMPLNAENLADIVDKEMNTYLGKPNAVPPSVMGLAMLLQQGLTHTFPCKVTR
jgi:hypothetical protein